MSLTEDIKQLILAGLLAVLGSYLLYKHFQRERQRRKNYAEWTGKSIDVTPLKPALDEVRRNYPRPQPTGASFHRSLLALARRAVTHFGYFQERAEQPNRENHAQ